MISIWFQNVNIVVSGVRGTIKTKSVIMEGMYSCKTPGKFVTSHDRIELQSTLVSEEIKPISLLHIPMNDFKDVPTL